MSISISNISLSSNFNLTNISGTATMLRDFKINGRYIDKIYWRDPNIFGNQPNNCGLIYKRHKKPTLYSANISFSCFDIVDNSLLEIDSIKIDNNIIDDYSMTIINTDNNERYIYNFNYDQISAQFNLMILKTEYTPATIVNSISGYILNKINYVDLGRIPLIPTNKENGHVLIWDKYPRDLDSYMLGFDSNFNLKLTVYYNTKTSEYSGIMLDRDDTTAYGPETITLNNPHNDYYYLYSIHNYTISYGDYYPEDYYLWTLLMDNWTELQWSAFYSELLNNVYNFNYNNKTRISLIIDGKIYTINPPQTNAQTKYLWYDICLRHNNKIYIIDQLIAIGVRGHSDSILWNFLNTLGNKVLLLSYINNAKQIIDIQKDK